MSVCGRIVCPERPCRQAGDAYAASGGLAPTRMLARHQVQPCRQLAPVLSHGDISDSHHQGGRGQRSNPFGLDQPLAGLVVLKHLLHLAFRFRAPLVHGVQFGCKSLSPLARIPGQTVSGTCQDRGQHPPHLGDTLRDDHPILCQQPPDLIEEHRPSLDLAPANTVESLNILLLH
jgi:hypothetical protein